MAYKDQYGNILEDFSGDLEGLTSMMNKNLGKLDGILNNVHKNISDEDRPLFGDALESQIKVMRAKVDESRSEAFKAAEAVRNSCR